jgi:integrase
MPSLRKLPNSPYFIACFRDAQRRQFNRSTKETERPKAMAVALEYERMARGWIGDNPTIAAVHSLATELAERIGKPLESPSIRAEFDTFTASLGAKTPHTRQRYTQITRQFVERLGRKADDRLLTLTTRDVQSYRDARLASGISPQGVAWELKVIKSVLSRAMKAGRIEKNPAVDVELPSGKAAVREIFEAEHVRALLLACERHTRGKDWRGLILTAFYTGARLSDVANLKWSNVDFSKNLIRFIPQKTKRHAGEIQLPLHPQLEAHLLSLSAPDAAPDAPLFPSLAGRGTGGAHGLSCEFVGLLADAGIERRALCEATGKGRKVHNLGAHSFRHAFATHLQRGGVPEDVRMRLTGHETKDIARRYSHVEMKQLRAAVEVLPGIDAAPRAVLPRKAKRKKGAQ